MFLHVDNVSSRVTKSDLKKLFEEYGQVARVKLVIDPKTRKSLGRGFVEFIDEHDAYRAYEELNGNLWRGRKLEIEPPTY